MTQIPLNEEIASSASLSMVLEAASYPKPGNVHRLQDFKETSFEHFMASALSVQTVFMKGANSSPEGELTDFGSLFYEAVFKSRSMQSGGNTHFGTFILLLPLSIAAGYVCSSFKKCEQNGITSDAVILKASEICRATTSRDAICFYKAYNTLFVPVQKTEKGKADFEFDLTNAAAIEKIKTENIPLFDLMVMGAERDMIAAEWVNGFEKSKKFAGQLQKNKAYFEEHPKKRFGSAVNSAVVYTFLEFMSLYPDTFIVSKYDEETAFRVQKKAGEIMVKLKKSKNLKKMIPEIQKLDEKLQKERINPGSLADITAAGIFIAILEGLKI